MAEIPLIEKGSSNLGLGAQAKTYNEQAYQRRLNYKPPVAGPVRRPFEYVGGGVVPGGIGPSPILPPSPGNFILANSTSYVLINSTDKFII